MGSLRVFWLNKVREGAKTTFSGDMRSGRHVSTASFVFFSGTAAFECYFKFSWFGSKSSVGFHVSKSDYNSILITSRINTRSSTSHSYSSPNLHGSMSWYNRFLAFHIWPQLIFPNLYPTTLQCTCKVLTKPTGLFVHFIPSSLPSKGFPYCRSFTCSLWFGAFLPFHTQKPMFPCLSAPLFLMIWEGPCDLF